MRKHILILIFSTSILFSYGKSYLQSFQVVGFEESNYEEVAQKAKKLFKKYSYCNIIKNKRRLNATKLSILCSAKKKITLKRFKSELKRKTKHNVVQGKVIIRKL